MNFIELFNAVARVAKPMSPDYNLAGSLDDKFQDIDVDSLDCMLIGMYLCDIYGISEEVSKGLNPTNMQEMYDLLMLHKTKEPTSVEQAILEIQ
jgi:hypothetical protein